MKKLIYSVDPLLNRIMSIENRLAVLEGKKEPHTAFCATCKGKKVVEKMISYDEYDETPCKDCQG